MPESGRFASGKCFFLVTFLVTAAIALFTALVLPAASFGWEGYDDSYRSFIYIDDSETMETGRSITVYDYSDGTDHICSVLEVSRELLDVEIVVYDPVIRTYRYFELER